MVDDRLMTDLGSNDRLVRTGAIERLRALLPESLPPVLAAARSERWVVRAAALAVLDHAEQDPEVEQALLAAAHDPDSRVRRSALHSLACAHCKPDGCVSPGAVDVLLDAMLHDPTLKVRRSMAGQLMWGQAGRGPSVVEAFRHLLAHDDDAVLRRRSATFLASCELPRGELPHREWVGPWEQRISELLASPTG
jgi:HEAT repeat protein